MITYLGEQVMLLPLETPAAPALTRQGSSGATTYTYRVVARRGLGHTESSSEASLSDGPSSLSTLDFIQITPPYVQGAHIFDLYRTVGGPSQGKIGSFVPIYRGTTQVGQFPDYGQAGDGIRTKVTVEGPKASATAAAKYDREIELEATDTTLENGDGLTAKAGEKIEFKLENKGTKKRNLEIIDPATKVIEEIEVEAGKDGEFIVALTTAGTWKLKVEGGDQEFEKAVIVG